jgi:hypothetical protein
VLLTVRKMVAPVVQMAKEANSQLPNGYSRRNNYTGTSMELELMAQVKVIKAQVALTLTH